jgi:hypothetical protein
MIGQVRRQRASGGGCAPGRRCDPCPAARGRPPGSALRWIPSRRPARRPRPRGRRPRVGQVSAIVHALVAQLGHAVVVGGVVADVAAAILLLDPADAVLEPGRAGQRPGSRERVRVTQVGQEVAVRGVGWRTRTLEVRQVGQVVDLGQPPGLGRVGEVAVGQQHHRGAVGQRDAGGFDRGVEAVGRRLAATTGIGASPLRPYMTWNRSDCSVLVGRPVDGPPRCTLTIRSGQLGDHRQAHRLGLQRDARPDDAVTPGHLRRPRR